MGVDGCISGGSPFAVQSVGLLAQPLDTAREANPVVCGEEDVEVEQSIVAQYEKTALPLSPKRWLQITPQIIKPK